MLYSSWDEIRPNRWLTVEWKKQTEGLPWVLYSSFCFIQLIPELQEMLDGGKIEMVKVIAAANQKDGWSKTSVVANLGVGLAMEEKKVAVIGADPQWSLTASLGYEKDQNHDWWRIWRPENVRECESPRPYGQGVFPVSDCFQNLILVAPVVDDTEYHDIFFFLINQIIRNIVEFTGLSGNPGRFLGQLWYSSKHRCDLRIRENAPVVFKCSMRTGI